MSFPFYKQYDAMDCGPTCLRMIAKYYGRETDIGELRSLSQISKDGVSLLGLGEAAEALGYKILFAKVSFEQLDNDVLLPCVLHWSQSHFVVLPPQNYNKNRKSGKILIADPRVGLVKIDKETFIENWQKNEPTGIVLILEPTPAFFKESGSPGTGSSWAVLTSYLLQHRKYFFQIFLGLFVASGLQLVFPFLTQSIVDTGINMHNLRFIYIVLIAQFMLFFARTVVEFLRSRLLLYISTHINISLLTNFWLKLMRLPAAYFDTKLTGDIQQRIEDQRVIEQFLTGSSLAILFSTLNLLVFSVVLYIYNLWIFAIFIFGSLLYYLVGQVISQKRRDLNYKRFAIMARENSATMQIVNGMQEIKLYNAERYYRWDWEASQGKLFKLNVSNLSLNHISKAGRFLLMGGRTDLSHLYVQNWL